MAVVVCACALLGLFLAVRAPSCSCSLQPSIDIFESFDELLLLRLGGRTIYHGPIGHQSSELIKYFQVRFISTLHPPFSPTLMCV